MFSRALRSTLLAVLLIAGPAHAQVPEHLSQATVEALAPAAQRSKLRLHPFSFSNPLFKIPMVQVKVGPEHMPMLRKLPDELERFARTGLEAGARPGSMGYDWMFPQVYSHVTREIIGLVESGALKRPDLMRTEIAQFYEVYARNLRAWQTSKAEPAWDRAARVSHRLARVDVTNGRARHDRMTYAGVVLLQSMYAHITVDLPRVLLMIYYSQRPATPEAGRKLLDEMRSDFYALTPAFDRSVDSVLTDQWVAWEDAEELPPFFRTVVQRFGAGSAVRLLRTWAFERFEYNLRKMEGQSELLALPTTSEVTHIDAEATARTALLAAP